MACWWLSSSYIFPSSFCEQIAAKDTSHWVRTPIMTPLQLITLVRTPLSTVSPMLRPCGGAFSCPGKVPAQPWAWVGTDGLSTHRGSRGSSGLLVPGRLQAGTWASRRRTSGGTTCTLLLRNGPRPEPSASSAESGWEARPGAWRPWAEWPVSSWPCGRWGLVWNLRSGGPSMLSGLCLEVPGAGWRAQQGEGLRLQPPRGSGTCLIGFVGADPPGGQAWPGCGGA